MGGFFGAASQTDCVFDLFFGIDYHSHLGTRRAGMAVYSPETGFDKAIHNIENAPFRTKFTTESQSMHGTLGIGCISDYEAQPILVRSHHGTFAITTIGKINNANEIVEDIIGRGTHFFEMQNGEVNPTELVAAIIDQKENFIDGIRYAQEVVDGSLSMLVLTPRGIYAARDKLGRTPIVLGQKEDGYCASFESFAYLNLGYHDLREKGRRLILPVGNGEIEVVLAKAADVITYVENGVCDLGVVGKDTIMENGSHFYEILDLGFGRCRFALACRKGTDFFGGYKAKTVASKYPNVARQFFESRAMDVRIIKIEGSVELAPLLGLADGIVDIVETGTTLKENGLEVTETIAGISARLIANTASLKMRKQEIEALAARMEAQIEKNREEKSV